MFKSGLGPSRTCDSVRICSADDGRVLWSKEKVLIAKTVAIIVEV
jgi:hypothetical protein